MPFYPGYGYPFFPPFGIFLGIGFFLFVLFLIGGAFRHAAWRHWAGAQDSEHWRGPGPWGNPGYGHPGPYWHHGWKEQTPEQGEKSAPAGEPPEQV